MTALTLWGLRPYILTGCAAGIWLCHRICRRWDARWRAEQAMRRRLQQWEERT